MSVPSRLDRPLCVCARAVVEIQQADGRREEVIVEQVGAGPVEVVTVPVVTVPEGVAPVQ